ncbi:hypothetical protein L0152_31695 [bacterium]|nr:hypothetical protein [bacterium]
MKRVHGLLVALAMFIGIAVTAQAQHFCSQTAQALFDACKAGVTEDFLVRNAECINISDPSERDECFGDSDDERKEENLVCREQRDWRFEACELIGEERYDPDFDPGEFDTDFHNLTNPNPYFPLTIGNKWTFRNKVENELNRIEVLNQTKLIDGVTCIVVRDKVFKDGFLVENTDDWFAQNTDKTVWYCGEEVKDYEVFDGDQPKRPELVSIDGSFKAGRDGDKPGIIFLAKPRKGDVYLEEFSLGNAEDVTEILSTSYSFGKNSELDHLVPQQLAERFCSNSDCIVTSNFSLLEPGIVARKYAASGIGVFLEVELDSDAVVQLIECNFDPRCENLPQP